MCAKNYHCSRHLIKRCPKQWRNQFCFQCLKMGVFKVWKQVFSGSENGFWVFSGSESAFSVLENGCCAFSGSENGCFQGLKTGVFKVWKQVFSRSENGCFRCLKMGFVRFQGLKIGVFIHSLGHLHCLKHSDAPKSAAGRVLQPSGLPRACSSGSPRCPQRWSFLPPCRCWTPWQRNHKE